MRASGAVYADLPMRRRNFFDPMRRIRFTSREK
jgi:hypothetical protein